MRLRKIWFCLLLFAASAHAATSVQDDAGQTVVVSSPPQRIVVLAPHAMELLHAAGGENRIVGRCGFCDYPKTAQQVEVVGDNRQMDLERVLRLQPDLVIAWRYGIPQWQLERLRRRGIAVFLSDPLRLLDIPGSIERLGVLLGTEKQAFEFAQQWRKGLAVLKARYSKRERLRVFWQVSARPLYTLNGQHIVSEAIQVCGGKNVFDDVKALAPNVSVESVLVRNPQVIVSASVDSDDGVRAYWQCYPMVKAVRNDNVYRISPDLLSRPGPRMLEGVKALCGVLEKARNRAVAPATSGTD